MYSIPSGMAICLAQPIVRAAPAALRGLPTSHGISGGAALYYFEPGARGFEPSVIDAGPGVDQPSTGESG